MRILKYWLKLCLCGNMNKATWLKSEECEWLICEECEWLKCEECEWLKRAKCEDVRKICVCGDWAPQPKHELGRESQVWPFL